MSDVIIAELNEARRPSLKTALLSIRHEDKWSLHNNTNKKQFIEKVHGNGRQPRKMQSATLSPLHLTWAGPSTENRHIFISCFYHFIVAKQWNEMNKWTQMGWDDQASHMLIPTKTSRQGWRRHENWMEQEAGWSMLHILFFWALPALPGAGHATIRSSSASAFPIARERPTHFVLF